MSAKVLIRMASESDAEEILEIYSPYVRDTAITFDYEIPSVSEFAHRIHNTLKKYPYLVAVEEDRIIGYACASAFKERAACDWAVETTLYLKQDCRGRGVGKMLYVALEDILKRQHILNLNACIAYTAVEDTHLDHTSVAFHQHLGYRKVAHFTKCGYKFGTWYDVICMEKMLGEHPAAPQPFVPITEM
jgi:L-amino acid N-acyltransferase YncA